MKRSFLTAVLFFLLLAVQPARAWAQDGYLKTFFEPVVAGWIWLKGGESGTGGKGGESGTGGKGGESGTGGKGGESGTGDKGGESGTGGN